MQDRYKHPGVPVLRTLPNGHRVLQQHNGNIFLIGQGASPKGDLPFLDRLNLTTLKTERSFHSAEKTYEAVLAVLAPDGSRVLTRFETPTEPPNYFTRAPPGGKKDRLTNFADPCAATARHPEPARHLQARRRRAAVGDAGPAAGVQGGAALAGGALGVSARSSRTPAPPARSAARRTTSRRCAAQLNRALLFCRAMPYLTVPPCRSSATRRR